MTQLIDLGKLRFSFAGEWSSTTTYESNDIVKYGGNVYVYTYAVSTLGNLPTNTTYWALMVEGIKFKGVFSASTAYKVGDAIAYGGKVYIAVSDTTGNTPPNVTYWSQFADGIQYEGVYSDSGQYQKNDIVSYGSSAYIALQDTSGNLPTNGTYWAKLVEGVSASGAWSSTTAYVPNDVVAYGANQYKAIANNTNQVPINATGTLNSNWIVLTEGVRSRGDWTATTEYYINDVVQHGGSSYICIVRNASTTFEADLTAARWKKYNSGIRWRGAWAASTSYFRDDVVKSSVGSAYIATADHTSSSSFNSDLAAGSWVAFVTGGSDVLPTIQATDTGQSLTVTNNGSSLDWIGATMSDKVYYVAPHGVDNSTQGRNMSTPFASIKYATQQCGEGATIFVKTGTYSEQLPITIPANTAIVGDNQRTVIVQPKSGNDDSGLVTNVNSTMFYMSNGSILNKMTFKGMTGWVPGSTAADITSSTIKGVVVRLNSASPITTKSPYVLECAFIGSGAVGALIDGTVHSTGAKTMIFHGYTVINDNGVGYWVKDGGKSEIVSCFTYYCYFGYAASGGGFIRALNGNNSYGTYGANSRGYDSTETPVTGSLVGQQLPFTYTGGNISVGDTVTSSGGATATVTNVQYSANKVYIKNITGTFATSQTLTFTSGGTGTVLSAVEGQKGFVLVASGFSSLPLPGASVSLSDDTYAYVIQSTSGSWTSSASEISLLLTQEKPTSSAAGASVTVRYKYSQVRLTGHDFLSIGTGGVTTTNYPGVPTQAAAQGNEVIETFPGRVFYASTDQDGNLRIGKYFKIEQATGKATLNASAFDLSGLSTLRLGSIGAQLGETINEFSSDGTLSANSNQKVPTQAAVTTFVASKLSTDTTLATGGNAKAPTVTAVKTYVDATAVSNSILGDTYAYVVSTTAAFSGGSYRASFISGGASFTWSLSGSYPSGMTISQSGVLSNGGATIAAGSYSFNIVVTSGSATATRTITITANANVPTFSTATIPTLLTPSAAYTINAATATVPSGTITYALASGSLPSGMSLSTSTGVLSGTGGASSSTPIAYNFTISATANGYTITKLFSGVLYFFVIQGQSLFGTNVGAGTYSWVAPTGVTSVSAVAVGGGHGGSGSWSYGGGAGGGLGYKNNITVVPGTSYTVVVGKAGSRYSGPNYYNENSETSSPGGNSYFLSTATVLGQGGGRSDSSAYDTYRYISSASGYSGGGYVGDGGGRGGNISSTWTCGGAGAGGYSGRGGCYDQGYQSTYGGALGDYYSSTYGTGAGGGIGLVGDTGTDRYGTYRYTIWTGYYQGTGSYGGGGGHGPGGTDGAFGENQWSNPYYGNNIYGGTYGGGGGGSGTSYGGGNGAQGGVRIIWGTNRSFPGTNTADVTIQSL